MLSLDSHYISHLAQSVIPDLKKGTNVGFTQPSKCLISDIVSRIQASDIHSSSLRIGNTINFESIKSKQMSDQMHSYPSLYKISNQEISKSSNHPY